MGSGQMIALSPWALTVLCFPVWYVLLPAGLLLPARCCCRLHLRLTGCLPACPRFTACRERFELAHLPAASNEADGEAAAAAGAAGAPAAERYRFSRCRRPLSAAVMAKLGVPLPEGERTVLHDDLGWEEIQVGGRLAGWGRVGGWVAVLRAGWLAGWLGVLPGSFSRCRLHCPLPPGLS